MAALSTLVVTCSGMIPTQKLAPLPQPIAGQFVGVIENTVIVAGGSYWKVPNWPTKAGPTKIWETSVLGLQPGERDWRVIARLPQPLAYGGSVSLMTEVVLAGGQSGPIFSRDVRALVRRNADYELTQWPPLPTPLANFSMGAVDGRIYIFGGQTSPNALASAHLWSLAVDSAGMPTGQWVEGPSLPAKGRILAAAAGCGDTLYIVSGATLLNSTDGSVVRNYLTDVWSYSPPKGWQRLPDVPRPAAAAPAVCDSAGLLIMGGDDRHVAGGRPTADRQFPGFSRTVLRFDLFKKTWSTAGELPVGLVTTGAALLRDGSVVIPGGEDRPGSRSADVLHFGLHAEGGLPK